MTDGVAVTVAVPDNNSDNLGMAMRTNNHGSNGDDRKQYIRVHPANIRTRLEHNTAVRMQCPLLFSAR